LDKTVRLYRQQYDGAGVMMVGCHEPIHARDDSAYTIAYTSDEQRRDAENQAAMHHHDYRQLSTCGDENGCLEIRARLKFSLILCAFQADLQPSILPWHLPHLFYYFLRMV
jgi:hypothetical protein